MGRRRDDQILLTSAALGAIAGLRSMAAPALLTHEISQHTSARGRSALQKALASEGISRLLALFAGGEMLADKAPDMPDRTTALPLAGRAVIGSLTAAAFASHKRYPIGIPAAIGAAAAVASTFGSFHLRRIASENLNVPDQVLGLVEDAIVVAVSKGVAEAMMEPQL